MAQVSYKKIFASFCILVLTNVLCAQERNWSSAQEAYTKMCGYCHNAGVGPDSVKIKFNKDGISARVKSIVYVARHGLNAMPAFRKTEIDDITLKELAEGLAKGTIK